MGLIMSFSGNFLQILLLLCILHSAFAASFTETNGVSSDRKYVSAIGDPGMKSPNVRVALEAWNFCNEVGFEDPNMGSPRWADCADFYCSSFITGIISLIVTNIA